MTDQTVSITHDPDKAIEAADELIARLGNPASGNKLEMLFFERRAPGRTDVRVIGRFAEIIGQPPGMGPRICAT